MPARKLTKKQRDTVKVLINQHGWTKSDVARRFGVSMGVVTRASNPASESPEKKPTGAPKSYRNKTAESLVISAQYANAGVGVTLLGEPLPGRSALDMITKPAEVSLSCLFSLKDIPAEASKYEGRPRGA